MRRALLVGLTLLMGLGGCIGVVTPSDAPPDRAPGTWTRLAPMLTMRQETGVAEAGAKLYVIGGFGDGLEPSDTVEMYDPTTNVWALRAPLPLKLHHPAAVGLNGKVYVFGGYLGRVSWTAVATVFEYDPLGNAWRGRASMPTARGGLAAAALGGGIHVIGGAAGPSLNTHEVYDPTSDRWSQANPMPTPRDHLAAAALGGRVYAIGGRRSLLGDQYANVEIYDPATDSWRVGAPLPLARGGLAATAIGGRIVALGGELPFRIVSATEMYDPGANRWFARAPMPTPRHGMGAATIGPRVYAPGGGTRPGLGRTNVLEAFEP